MAKHKAPTQVTIAATEERTFLHELVDRYWKTATLVVFAIIAGTMVMQWRDMASQESSTADWNRVWEEITFPPFGNFQAPAPEVMANLSNELGGSPAASWAKAIEVAKHVEEGDVEAAKTALAALAAEWPDHEMVTRRIYPGPDGQKLTLAEHLENSKEGLTAWEADHRFLFENPALPAEAPKVKLTTSRGDIVLGLYNDRAPKHSENFLKHCRDGYYDGLKFHRVIREFMIQSGDPNTRDGDPETWGQGGPGYTQEAEIDPELKHFKGTLAAAKKPGATESSGSQFYITTADYHSLDGQYTIFGLLLEGEDVVREIETGAAVSERPQDPVVIESATVME